MYVSFDKRYNEIQDKVNKVIKKGFDNESVYNKKYLKTKIKSYEGKINTNFHNDKIPKEDSHCTCLLDVLIVSVFKIGKNYYPQVFLEECKYFVKEKEVTKHITEEIEISSDDSD